MPKINIKPLSVNKAWQGRRYKTGDYKSYEQELLLRLPPLEIPEGKLCLKIVASYKNRRNDIDNCLKPFLDILQKRYDFDDARIYRLEVDKRISKHESIEFEISKI